MPSFRSFAPSLILLTIYFIADEFLSPEIGLICIILLGGGELAYTRIIEKRFDKFMVFTTILFCLTSLFSIYTQNSSLKNLQSIFFESIILLLLGILAFSKIDFTGSLPTAQRELITKERVQAMREIIKTLFYLVLAHFIIAILVTIYANREIASFISETMLYLIIGAFFISLFIKNRIKLHSYRKEEWLPIINEKGEVTGKAPRSICHNGSKLLHPVVHLHIINSQGELFLQKRSTRKTLLPGMWDTAVGGHVSFNENIEDALKRETFEELGITQFESQFINTYIWESAHEKELVFSFICTQHSPINIKNDEVDEGRFWTKNELTTVQNKSLLTPNFIYEYTNFLADLLLHK